MGLKEEDIINAIESYRNKNRYSQQKMAELCGMSSSSVYNNWIHKKSKGRLEYLIEFMNNAEVSFCDKNGMFVSKKGIGDVGLGIGNTSPPKPQIDEKEFNRLKEENLELLRELHRLSKDYIEMLTRQGGGHIGKKLEGGVAKSKSGS